VLSFRVLSFRVLSFRVLSFVCCRSVYGGVQETVRVTVPRVIGMPDAQLD
jgi:hypothetical protein